MIKLDYKSGRSIHEQIQDGIKSMIVGGVLKENDQLPSVRELSLSLTVNPNTVQKAYKELEKDGIIYSVKGKGNFVSRVEADSKTLDSLLKSLERLVGEMCFVGIEKKDIEKVIAEVYKKDR